MQSVNLHSQFAYSVLTPHHHSSCLPLRTTLLFHRPTLSFHHYDSLAGRQHNRKVAQRIADRFLAAFAPHRESKAVVTAVSLQKQTNSFDCGLYVCCVADMVSTWARGNSSASSEGCCDDTGDRQSADHTTDYHAMPKSCLGLKELRQLNDAIVAKLTPVFVGGERGRMLHLITRLADA